MKLTLTEDDDTVLDETTVTAAEWRQAEMDERAAAAILHSLNPGESALLREEARTPPVIDSIAADPTPTPTTPNGDMS